MIALLCILIFTGCMTTDKAEYDNGTEIGQYQENVLVAINVTQEEAKEIAEKCGIEFTLWEYDVATFYTEKNLDEVINYAEENKIAHLTKNYYIEE